MNSIAAVLLAGGKSTRMGREKALLPLPGGRGVLWEHQLKTLRELGPQELAVSTAPETAMCPPDGVRLIPDREPGRGPLQGLYQVFTTLPHDFLLVLAVDLPLMNAAFLGRLLDRAQAEKRSCIPLLNGRWEPLASVWHRSFEARVQASLGDGSLALQPLISEGEGEGLVAPYAVPEEEAFRFQNANTPEDWDRILGEIGPCPDLTSA